MQSAVEALSAVSAQISTSIDEATQNVQSVAAASKDLSASITEVEANMKASRTIAGNAVAQVESAANANKELNAATQQINAIVALIGDIDEQTNLLALNATIEAARAGETGRGFSVVAGEVKALAERTGQATTDINKCIQEVQHSTGTRRRARWTRSRRSSPRSTGGRRALPTASTNNPRRPPTSRRTRSRRRARR